MINPQDLIISELIPHSEDMILLDKIVTFSSTSLIAELSIYSGCKFWSDSLGRVPIWIGLEYMAQSIAALAGIHAKLNNQSIKLGFLLGTRSYKCLQQGFFNGKIYLIDIRQVYRDEQGMASFDCKISNSNLSTNVSEIVTTARLNVFETNDISKIYWE